MVNRSRSRWHCLKAFWVRCGRGQNPWVKSGHYHSIKSPKNTTWPMVESKIFFNHYVCKTLYWPCHTCCSLLFLKTGSCATLSTESTESTDSVIEWTMFAQAKRYALQRWLDTRLDNWRTISPKPMINYERVLFHHLLVMIALAKSFTVFARWKHSPHERVKDSTIMKTFFSWKGIE